jgi:hypothetical protein
MTSQGHRDAQFQRALKTGDAHLALAAAAELRHIGLADALSLVFLIRDDDPQRYDRAAVRWLARYAAQDRAMRLAEARELVDLLDGAGRHDRSRGCGSSGGYALAAIRMRPTGWPDRPITPIG